MPTSHPYISGPVNIVKIITQLRKSFPSIIDSKTVKKFGYAPNNESFLISVLQFIEIIDSDGKKLEKAAKIFNLHKDDEFQKDFSGLVKNAYSPLFELYGEASWTLKSEDLINFFRQNDQTGEAVGKMQANTFKTLSSLSGYAEAIEVKVSDKSKPSNKVKSTSKDKNIASQAKVETSSAKGKTDFGLSVRIEINLPADGTKETYDSIFKSIRENLLNG